MTSDMKRLINVFIFALASINASALPEASLATDFRAKLLPFLAEHGTQGQFTGAAGLHIQYLVVPAKDPQGVLVISPGKGEPFLKYAEIIYDLQDLGYTIYVIDHRGQGFSDRLLLDPVKSHVEKFVDYVTDFTYFVNNIVKPRTYKYSVLLTHSMGGAIGTGFLHSNPKAFDRAIIVAPMYKVNTSFLGQNEALILANILELVGRADSYAPGQKPYDPEKPFAENIQTSSEARFMMNKDLLNIHPELRVGGSTVNWVRETLKYTSFLRVTDNILPIPTLMFQAGDDQYVLPEGEDEVCDVRSPNQCRMVHFPHSQHEILQEQDSIREPALRLIRSFIDEKRFAAPVMD
jgi:lysophospholipase